MKASKNLRSVLAMVFVTAGLCSGTAKAADVGSDSYWNDISNRAQETYDRVSEKAGNSWDNIRERVNEARQGVRGMHDRSWDEIQRGFDSTGPSVK